MNGVNNVPLRRMTESDLLAADRLRDLAGWNQTIDDWRRFLSLEPEGCFVAEREGAVIGTVTTTTYGRALAWIGMMLVHPDQRGRGLGTQLMKRALEYLQGLAVECIRLDATPAGRPVYEKLGFVPEWPLTRYQRPATNKSEEQECPIHLVRELKNADWPAVEEIDARSFGVSRLSLLQNLAPGRRSAICEVRGRVGAWGLLRSGAKADYLGPISGVSRECCVSLVRALLHGTEARPVIWDLPDENGMAADTPRRLGFQVVRPFTRMRLGANSVVCDPQKLFALADPALG